MRYISKRGDVQVEQVRKYQWIIFSTRSVQIYDVIPNQMITLKVYLVHLTLFIDVGPLSYAEATTSFVWINFIEK